MEVTDAGMEMEGREGQELKVPALMVVTEVGMLTEEREVQETKALEPMAVIIALDPQEEQLLQGK